MCCILLNADKLHRSWPSGGLGVKSQAKAVGDKVMGLGGASPLCWLKHQLSFEAPDSRGL